VVLRESCPAGIVIAPKGDGMPQHLEALALVAEDFASKKLWRFDAGEQVERDGKTEWSGRQHHDWQLTSFPSGAFSPGANPVPKGASILLHTHSRHTDPAIADVALDDDKLIELDPSGKVVWQWRAGDHVDEFGFTPAARAAIRRGGKRDG
jgi:hypothetical protein